MQYSGEQVVLLRVVVLSLLVSIGILGPRPVLAMDPMGGCPDLIIEVFGENAPAACSVAYCETGGTFDPYATGAAGERGWFQIHPIHGWYSSYDTMINTQYAYVLSKGGTDWHHWSC